jgi:Uncharacterised nucleotidyltransferase
MYSVESHGLTTSVSGRVGRRTAFELILACAAAAFPPQAAGEALLPGELDWEQVVALAERHGLLSVVYTQLAASDGVSESAIRHLRTLVEQNARQGLWLARLLGKIFSAFRDHGIVALPYKGPVLAAMLYGNVTLRQYSDLDILIRPADLALSRRVLAESGLTPASPLTSRQEKAQLSSGYEEVFDAAGKQNVVEIQWRVLPRFYAIDFDMEKMFTRARKVSIAGQDLQTLSTEDLLLVLCAHAAKHCWAKLSWIRDIAELARSVETDWDRMLADCERLGIRRIVGISFLLANQLLGASLPDAIREAIKKDPEIRTLSVRLAALLAAGLEPAVDSPEYFRLMIAVREKWTHRVVFVSRLATTPTVSEWSLVNLPGPMAPFYRVVRMGRVARRLMRA